MKFFTLKRWVLALNTVYVLCNVYCLAFNGWHLMKSMKIMRIWWIFTCKSKVKCSFERFNWLKFFPIHFDINIFRVEIDTNIRVDIYNVFWSFQYCVCCIVALGVSIETSACVVVCEIFFSCTAKRIDLNREFNTWMKYGVEKVFDSNEIWMWRWCNKISTAFKMNLIANHRRFASNGKRSILYWLRRNLWIFIYFHMEKRIILLKMHFIWQHRSAHFKRNKFKGLGRAEKTNIYHYKTVSTIRAVNCIFSSLENNRIRIQIHISFSSLCL